MNHPELPNREALSKEAAAQRPPEWSRVDPSHPSNELLRLSLEPEPHLSALACVIHRIPELEEAIRLRANAIKKGLPKKIRNLEHALAVLGLAQVREMIQDRLNPKLRSHAEVNTNQPENPPFRRSA